MITLTIHKKNENKRGPSYWKLNSSILVKKEIKQNHLLLTKMATKEENTKNLPFGQKSIQGLIKDFCTNLKQTERNHIQQLKTEL